MKHMLTIQMSQTVFLTNSTQDTVTWSFYIRLRSWLYHTCYCVSQWKDSAHTFWTVHVGIHELTQAVTPIRRNTKAPCLTFPTREHLNWTLGSPFFIPSKSGTRRAALWNILKKIRPYFLSANNRRKFKLIHNFPNKFVSSKFHTWVTNNHNNARKLAHKIIQLTEVP